MVKPKYSPSHGFDGLVVTHVVRVSWLENALRATNGRIQTEPFSSGVCLAGLQNVDGLGELAGAPGAAAQLAEDAPCLELGVRAPAG